MAAPDPAPASPASAAKVPWAVAGAPYRVALQAASAPDDPSAGWQIRLPDFAAGRADMRDAILLDEAGKEIALDGVWRSPGRTLLLLAKAMPKDPAWAQLYFGGASSRRLRSWAARRSLLLETRRLPAGAKVATYGGWQDAWRQAAATVDGAAFVPLIFHGGNPFGEGGRFLSRYTGVLKTGAGGTRKFYTLSDDVSYVRIDGRAAFEWTKDQPPPRAPEQVPVNAVRLPKETVSVDYCHATVDPPAAMVLGWEQDGKLGNVPPEAWLHPGTVTAGAFESRDGAPVPAGVLEAERYLGFGGEWYVSVKGEVAPPGDGWQVEWLWPDGRVDPGPQIRRLSLTVEPVRVSLRFRKDKRLIEGLRVLVIPREMEAASVNNSQQLAPFLSMLEREDPLRLAEPARRAGFLLAETFSPPPVAARWAQAWLEVAAPAAGAWVTAQIRVIREIAKTDAQAALSKLAALSEPARAALGRNAELLELDLRVFGLNDPQVVDLAAKLRQSSDKALANMAAIRLGDYQLLNGRIDEALQCFEQAVADPGATARKAAVIDRSHSLAIEELLAKNHLPEARVKLDEWERQRPAAKLDGDQLMWRARVSFLAGEWKRALQDLQTSLKLRPGSPEEIDVLFWQARAFYELDNKPEARKIWNALIEDFPKHERAEAAKLWAQKP